MTRIVVDVNGGILRVITFMSEKNSLQNRMYYLINIELPYLMHIYIALGGF